MTNKSSPHRSPDPRRRDSAPPQRAGVTPTPLKFQPIHVRRTFEEICERIREQLALGVLKPGDKLPRERDLAEQLGVSRNVLKEALRSLEMAGLLRLQKGVKGGAFIQEGDMGRMNDVVRDMFSLGAISVRELSEDEFRYSISSSAWPASARRRTIFRRWKPISSGRIWPRVRADGSIGSNVREFYKLLAAATGNKVMAMIMESVTEIHMRFVYAKVASSGVSMPQLVEKRRQFLSALRARDVSSATRLMRVHLESVQRMLKSDPDAMSVHVALAEMQPGARRRAAQHVLTKSG